MGPQVVDGYDAADFAELFAGLETFRTTEPVDVTVGDYSGKRVQITVPSDEFADCATNGGGAAYESFVDEDEKSRIYEGPEQTDEIWILDLENGDRQLFLISYFPTTPADQVDQLRQMIESIQIDAPSKELPQPPGPTDLSGAAWEGNWEWSDADGDDLAMELTTRRPSERYPNGGYRVVIQDDSGSDCGGAASTLTGVVVPS